RDVDFRPAGSSFVCAPAQAALAGFNQSDKGTGKAQKLSRAHHKARKKVLQPRGGAQLSGDFQQLIKLLLLLRVEPRQLRIIQCQAPDVPEYGESRGLRG